jgi:hypothetical protein
MLYKLDQRIFSILVNRQNYSSQSWIDDAAYLSDHELLSADYCYLHPLFLLAAGSEELNEITVPKTFQRWSSRLSLPFDSPISKGIRAGPGVHRYQEKAEEKRL